MAKGSKSPTERALAHARAKGWPCGVVERYVRFMFPASGGGKRNGPPGKRFDLWGCIDMLVLDDEPGVLGVQVCAGASHANRAEKMRELIAGRGEGPSASDKAAALTRWVEKGNRLCVWSWSKTGARGQKKTWKLREERIGLGDDGRTGREEGAQAAVGG